MLIPRKQFGMCQVRQGQWQWNSRDGAGSDRRLSLGCCTRQRTNAALGKALRGNSGCCAGGGCAGGGAGILRSKKLWDEDAV